MYYMAVVEKNSYHVGKTDLWISSLIIQYWVATTWDRRDMICKLELTIIENLPSWAIFNTIDNSWVQYIQIEPRISSGGGYISLKGRWQLSGIQSTKNDTFPTKNFQFSVPFFCDAPNLLDPKKSRRISQKKWSLLKNNSITGQSGL